MEKYIVLVNDGVYGGGVVFDRGGVDRIFEEWCEGKEMIDEDGEVVSVEDLIELGEMGGKVGIVNKEMCEYGDDYVNLSVCELKM